MILGYKVCGPKLGTTESRIEIQHMEKSSKLYVGVDVGGTKIQASLITASGSVIANNRQDTPRDSPIEPILDAIEGCVAELLQTRDMEFADLATIGIAVPGVVEQDTGNVVVTPNMNLSGVELGQIMGARFKVPVAIGNDCNLGTLGECWLGSGRMAKSCVGIFVGTGIGAGIVIDNQVFSGAGQAAGEIGHIVSRFPGVDWRTTLGAQERAGKTKLPPIPVLPRCGCGNYGCFETFASRTAMERFIREAVADGSRSHIVELCGGNLDVIKSGAIAKALKMNDKVVTSIVRYAAQVIGYACLTVRHFFDPEVIVLGGGVIEACHKFMMPVIDEVIASDQLHAAAGHRRILVSSLGDNAVVLGAVALARSMSGANPLRSNHQVLPKYPKLKLQDDGVVNVNLIPFSDDFFLLADGNVQLREKWPRKHPDGFRLADLKTATEGGTDLLILATPQAGSVPLSGKCRDFLLRRGIDHRILPLGEAVHAYNATMVRRSAVFHF